MTCGVTGCGKQAQYRTVGEEISLLCTKHTEMAIDKGWPAEQIVSLPRRTAVA